MRARKFDIEKVKIMWTNFINWRKDNQVDEISVVNISFLIFQKYEFNEIDQVREFFPHGYCGVDKMGRPIYYERQGAIKIKKLFEVTNEFRLIK